MKLDLKDIEEKRTNLNAQEIGDDGRAGQGLEALRPQPGLRRGRSQADGQSRRQAPAPKCSFPTAAGAGSAGWGEQSWPHTTGRRRARPADRQAERRGPRARRAGTRRRVAQELPGRASPPQTNDAGKTTSPSRRSDADNLDAFVYMVLVDADVKERRRCATSSTATAPSSPVYAKAMFGLALHKQQADKLAMILKNIEQFVVQDDENQTAYLKLPEGNYWWYWYGSEIEANAYYLKLLAAPTPRRRSASRLVKYLLNNRKHATYWNSTRDTALCDRSDGRLHQGQRRRQAGHDRRSLARRQEAEGSQDQRRQPVHVRQQVRARRRRRRRRPAHGRAPQARAPGRCTSTPT